MNGFVFSKILEDFSETESAVRLLWQIGFNMELVNHDKKIQISGSDVVGHSKSLKEQNVYYFDPSLFKFFSIPLISGDVSETFAKPGYVVPSRTVAFEYFGRTDPTGKPLTSK